MKVVIAENQEDLDRLEGIIQTNLQSFVEVAHAFKEIRDRQYYRDILGFDTFEKYCRSRWDLGRRYMNRLIAAGDVVDNLGPMGPIPANERQVRPLTALTPEQQREAWQIVIDTTPEGKITERSVVQAVKTIVPKSDNVSKDPGRVKEAVSGQETELQVLDLLKKHWQAATPSDRGQFLLWINESVTTADSDSVDSPVVVHKGHETLNLPFADVDVHDYDQEGMHAA